MRGLPAIVVVVVVIVAFVISALVIGVVHVIAESVDIISPALNFADTLSSKAGNVLRHILDILLGIVPSVLDAILDVVVVVLDILRDVLDFTDLCSKLVCDRFGYS
jgi:phage-related protein